MPERLETDVALVITDMLSPYDHPDAEPLMESAREVVPRLSALIAEARERGLFVVYVNDNHDVWTAGRREIVQMALDGEAPELVEPILPPDDAPFVVKARHSIFYGTQLEYMLRAHGIERVVIAGQVAEQCILYSTLDAYVRHFGVNVPRDGVAHIHEDLATAALTMMERNMHADVSPAAEVLGSVLAA